MKIIHLRNNEIDRTNWDKCISQSTNQLTYAHSWYLDVVSPQWEALADENYDYIMPLPVKWRYKIPYLVQPILTQQLGIFSKNEINEEIVEDFIKAIPYFSYELNLNEQNQYSKAEISPNFLLDLHKPYEQITDLYSKNTLRNIEKAKKKKLKIKSNITIDEFLEFNSSVEKKFIAIRSSTLEELLRVGLAVNALNVYGVFSEENRLIAGLCILHSNKRLTYLLPVSNKEGKNASAMFFLIDYIIKNEANSEKTLDFEGSKVEGIARLYKGFGAKLQPYYILKKFRPSFLIGK
jgi:hypothetical protein